MNVHLLCSIVGFSVSVLPGQPGRAWNWSMFLQKTQMNKEAGEALSESEEAQWLHYCEMGGLFWHGRVLCCSILQHCSRLPEIAVLVREWDTNCRLKCSTILRGTCLHFQSCSWLPESDVSQCKSWSQPAETKKYHCCSRKFSGKEKLFEV